MLNLEIRSYLKVILISVLIFYPLSIFPDNLEGEEVYFIIVNSENPYKNKIDKGFRKISLIYKGNSKEWPGKLKATFISRGSNNLAEKEFYQKVLKMQDEEVQNYWKKKEKNGIYEPKSISNIRQLVNEMSNNLGAISIIAKSEIKKMPATIRVLYEF